jgi:hypothetical protein
MEQNTPTAVEVHSEHSALKPVGSINLDPAPRPIPDPPESIGTTAAARALGVSYNTIKRYIKQGLIKTLKLPSGQQRIPTEELMRIRKDMGLD